MKRQRVISPTPGTILAIHGKQYTIIYVVDGVYYLEHLGSEYYISANGIKNNHVPRPLKRNENNVAPMYSVIDLQSGEVVHSKIDSFAEAKVCAKDYVEYDAEEANDGDVVIVQHIGVVHKTVKVVSTHIDYLIPYPGDLK